MADNGRAKTVGATLGVSVVAALTLWTQTEVGDIKVDVAELRRDVNAIERVRDDIAELTQEVNDIAAVADDIETAINRAIRQAVRIALEQAQDGS